MVDMLTQALSLILNPEIFVAILIGSSLGIFLGAIPGLTGIMAIAIIIPFTYYMESVPALILLISISKSAIYSGGIPAILLNTPGTPADAATAMDGYPLAKSGKALKAMKMGLYASVIGDTFSDLVLILVAGVLASVALKFGPPEYAMLIVFSLTIIGAVSGKSMLKGLISAGAGLFLATIGLDPMRGTPRFDFGVIELYGGISLIPMLIGLFALAEVLRQAGHEIVGEKEVRFLPISENRDDNRVTKNDMKRCMRPILKSSAIGTFLGAIPGIGPTVAAFVSYGEAKRSSKHPPAFGEGNLEGVAASEAGNNATAGANLIPLLTLGVPGDVTAAVLLSAFMLQGLAPGPLLFEKNGHIIYTFFLGLLLCNVAYFFLGTLAIKISQSLFRVSKRVVLPVVLLLCCVGSYAINNSLFDVGVMLVFGVIGFFMVKFGFTPASMIIAFILEPILERGVRQSLIISQGNPLIFITHPVAIIFIVLTILVVASTIRRTYKDRVKFEKESSSLTLDQ
jgi:putative tricarboxylic transport membrane protein